MPKPTKKSVARVLELVTSIPWAITEEYPRTIVNVAGVFPAALAFEEGQEVADREMEIRRNGLRYFQTPGPVGCRARSRFFQMQVSAILGSGRSPAGPRTLPSSERRAAYSRRGRRHAVIDVMSRSGSQPHVVLPAGGESADTASVPASRPGRTRVR